MSGSISGGKYLSQIKVELQFTITLPLIIYGHLFVVQTEITSQGKKEYLINSGNTITSVQICIGPRVNVIRLKNV